MCDGALFTVNTSHTYMLNNFQLSQVVRLSGHRGRLCFSGLGSTVQPLPSDRAGPELQQSRRLRRETAL